MLKEAGKPMHVRDITEQAVRRGLIVTEGKTPEATMSAQILYEDRRPEGRFVRLGKNRVALREWGIEKIAEEIEAHEKAEAKTTPVRRASIVGDPINVDGLTYGPLNEQGVVYLFALLSKKLGFIVEEIKSSFPDAKGRRKNARGQWEEVWIEFEYKSSNFKAHGHDPSECDLIVCWENDWEKCPIEVMELRRRIGEYAGRH